MTIPYKDEDIKRIDEHNEKGEPYIGFISPKGDMIDFSLQVGEPGHNNWHNQVSQNFLDFVSFEVKGDSIEKYKNSEKTYENNKYEGFDNVVLRGMHGNINKDSYDRFINILNRVTEKIKAKSGENPWNELNYKLMELLQRCYSRKDFFYSLGTIISVTSEDTLKKLYATDLAKMNEEERQRFLHTFRVEDLVFYLKDIMVKYLHYDSIERLRPSSDVPIYAEMSKDSCGYDELLPPKVIFTSCPTPNERLYNWAINDWVIQRVPRMVWNKDEQRFVTDNSIISFYQSEREERLGKEIASIKKLVPKEERYKYQR